MSSFKKFINEGVLDSTKGELEPDVWPDGKLNPEVREIILSTFYDWLEENDIDKSLVKSVTLLGSIAGFQYGKNSDFDINVVMDLPLEQLKVLRKEMPNGRSPEGFDYPVNYFVTDTWQKSWEEEDNGVYNVIDDEWIKEPQQPEEKPFDSYKAVEETGRFFVAGIASVIAEYQSDVDAYNAYEDFLDDAELNDNEKAEEIKENMRFKVKEIIDDIDSLKIAKRVIKSLRDEAFDDGPLDLNPKLADKQANDSLNNLLYKYVERLGYFDKISEIKKTKDEWIKKQKELE